MGKLSCESPVPSDINIAQAATPVHISEIAQAVGLAPDEYDMYGTTKAKVLSHGYYPALAKLACTKRSPACIPLFRRVFKHPSMA